MGYKMFDGKSLLKRCRYMNGREELESVARTDLDFNEIDNWRSVSEAWGYLEFPEYQKKLLYIIGNRPCLQCMFIRILKSMYFPFFQCRAMLYIPESMLPDFIEKCLIDKENDSIIWACLEMWFYRIKNECESQRFEDKEHWLNNIAMNKTGELVKLFRKYGRIKTLMKWLFTNHHRDWLETPVGRNYLKAILLLVEAAAAFDWNDSDFDEDFKDIDYLTFVAVDARRGGGMSPEMASRIADCYHDSLMDDFTVCRLKENKDHTERMRGFASVFKIVYGADLVAAVAHLYDRYRWYFEGYRGRAAGHDYRHIRRMLFMMGAVEILMEDASLDPSLCRQLSDMTRRECLRSCGN